LDVPIVNFAFQPQEKKMMNKETLIIVGPVNDDEPTYWNNDQEWISDITEATHFDRRIFTAPLPGGTTGIMTMVDGEPVHFCGVADLGGGGVPA
jgi:hypothetical protein